MTHKDIQNYEDLKKYIAYEIKLQVTIKRQTVEIKLDKIWFFRAAKLITFILKNDKDEHDARKPLKDKMVWFKVTINGYKTTFRIYDL